MKLKFIRAKYINWFIANFSEDELLLKEINNELDWSYALDDKIVAETDNMNFMFVDVKWNFEITPISSLFPVYGQVNDYHNIVKLIPEWLELVED